MEKVKLTINLSQSKKEELRKIAEKKGLTMTSLVIMEINNLIEREKK